MHDSAESGGSCGKLLQSCFLCEPVHGLRTEYLYTRQRLGASNLAGRQLAGAVLTQLYDGLICHVGHVGGGEPVSYRFSVVLFALFLC